MMKWMRVLVALGMLMPSPGFGQGSPVAAEVPVIASVSPPTVAPGTIVAIELKGFPKAAEFSVLFDGVPAQVLSSDRNLVTVKVPESLTKLNERPTIYVSTKDATGTPARASLRDAVVLAMAKDQTATLLDRGFSLVEAILLILGTVIMMGVALRAYRRFRPTPASQTVSLPAAAPAILEVPPPTIPEPLVKALVSGEAIAYVGAGLSAQAGLVPWSALLFALIEELKDQKIIDAAKADIISQFIARDRVADAADALWRELRASQLPVGKHLERLLAGTPHKPADCHRELVRMPFAAWLTTNFDTLLEQAFPKDAPPVLTHRDSQRCLDALSRNERMILKISGSLDSEDTLLLGAHQFQEAVRGNESLREVVSRVFFNRTLFFIGTSFQGIEDFLQTATLRGATARIHYALVAVQDASWEARAAALRERFGVHVIPISLLTAGTDVTRFLRDLRSQVESRTRAAGAANASAVTARKTSWLRKVIVDNVGPFQHLELELDREWNLLLGDNGVGKSTILRAIAIALMGEEASPFAERIIRRGSETATITLETDTEVTYTTWIRRRTSGGVAIESNPSRASDAEGWLSVAFPALRTVTWDRPAGEGGLGARRPTAADLAPLLSDKADPRLDALKQRIVTLDHLSKTESVDNAKDRQHTRLLDELWRTFASLIEGQSITFESINPQTREIGVRTADGVIPVEALSQGTISMLSWVGVLLQRLYEVTPDTEDPKQRYGIVLIDEIDSHLHPAWQLSVVRSLSEAFRKIQFIATTHSPLLVRGMKGAQVFRFKRNAKGIVEQVDVPDDMTMGRPDQVLAGTLFDVDADLDSVTEEVIAEYQDLLVKEARNSTEETRYKELEGLLRFRIPVPATTPPDRRARELVDALIEQHIAKSAPETQNAVRERAHALITEVNREQTNRESRQ